MNSDSNTKSKAKKLVTNIFQILDMIKPKAQPTHPDIDADLRKVKNSIEDDQTIEQINEEELNHYKSIVEEIFSGKIDTTKIDTSKIEGN